MNFTPVNFAQSCVDRMVAQQCKGKARDRAALEFYVGAAALISNAIGTNNPVWSQLSIAATMVSVRGFKFVEEMAGQNK